MNGLLTDLYELTMAAGYFAAGKHREIGTFELTIRRLPRNRDFVLTAGLERGLDQFRNADPAFWDYLAAFRFTGDVFAVPDGSVIFEGQPIMNVHAPMIE